MFTQVTTKRAEGNWNADTPCYNSEVDKLEGCGREMSKNLQDVRACAREKGHGFVPPEGINYVKTGNPHWCTPAPPQGQVLERTGLFAPCQQSHAWSFQKLATA